MLHKSQALSFVSSSLVIYLAAFPSFLIEPRLFFSTSNSGTLPGPLKFHVDSRLVSQLSSESKYEPQLRPPQKC